MVAGGGKSSGPASWSDLRLTDEQSGDVHAYAALLDKIGSASHSRIKPSAATQMVEVVTRACQILTRRTVSEAVLEELDPLEGLRRKMKDAVANLALLEEAMKQVDSARLESQQRLNTVEDHSETWYAVDERPAGLALRSINSRRMEAAHKYIGNVVQIVNGMLDGAGKHESGEAKRGDEAFALDAKRRLNLQNHLCLALTTVELADVTLAAIDPYRKFVALDETCEDDLLLLQEAYHGDPRVKADEIAEWDALAWRMIRVQRLARSDPAKLMVYVFRDQSAAHKDAVIQVQWFHAAWFDTWCDPKEAYSLVMAPTGHGKSTCLRATDAWDLGHRPWVRLLIVTDAVSKAKDEIRLLAKVLTSGWYRAVFPEIRVLTRTASAKHNGAKASLTNRGFTVGTVGHSFAREQTVEGCSIFGNPNGSRYDVIRPDDWTPYTCRTQDETRERVHRSFGGVVLRRLDAGGRMRAAVTPWHPDDSASRIRKEARDHPSRCEWLVRADPFAIRRDAQGHPIPLWNRISQQDLERMSHDESFACTHELSPETAMKRGLAHVRYYVSNPLDPNLSQLPGDQKARLLGELQRANRGERWLSIDPSTSEGARACETGCGFFNLSEDGRLYLRAMEWFRGRAGDLQQWVLKRIAGEQLYKDRWINPDDSFEAKQAKLVLAQKAVPAAGDIDQVAIESGGPQTGQFTNMREHVRDGLKNMGILWNGTVHGCLPQDGSHTNVSKEIRFNGVANFLTDGTVQFPGQVKHIEMQGSESAKVIVSVGAIPVNEPGYNPKVAKLVLQLLNFPLGNKDGVDQTVQLITKLHGENRLGRGLALEEMAVRTGQDPMQVALQAALAEMRDPGPKETEMEKEEEYLGPWMQEALVA